MSEKYIKVKGKLRRSSKLTYADACSLLPKLSIKEYEKLTGNKYKYNSDLLSKLSFTELKDIASKFEIKGRSSKELIKGILEVQ